MHRRYDHIDLRVRSLSEARRFYETLLPALGFTHDATIEGWLQFEAAGADGATEFFGVTGRPSTVRTNAASLSGLTASARLIGWLRLLLVRERGTSKDPLMKFPNPGKPVTTPSFSRILAEIVSRSVTAPRTNAGSEKGTGNFSLLLILEG